MEEVTELKQPLDILFSTLEQEIDLANATRAEIIERLKLTIMNPSFNISIEDSPRMIEVKLATIKTLDDLCNNKAGALDKYIRTKLQRKETESVVNSKEATIAMLKLINPKVITEGSIQQIENIDAIMEHRLTSSLDDSILPINEEEMTLSHDS